MAYPSRELLAYMILKESEIMQEFENDLWIKINKEDYQELFENQVCTLCKDYSKLGNKNEQ